MIMALQVTGAEYLSGYRLSVRFSDNTEKTVDFNDFFIENSHPQFDKYKELSCFKKFKIDHGNLVWGKSWDLIFPVEQLHSGKIENML